MRVRPAFYERSHCNLPQLLSGISFVYTETDEEKVLHYSQLMFVRRRYPITGFPLTYVRLTRLGNDLGFVLVISIFPSPPSLPLSCLYSSFSRFYPSFSPPPLVGLSALYRLLYQGGGRGRKGRAV